MRASELPWTKIRPKLFSFIRARTKDSEIANDLVQEVFLKVYSKLDQLQDPALLNRWMFRIAYHTIMDHFRSHRHAEGKPLEVSDESEPDAGLNDCVAGCLKVEMQQMPQHYQQAIELAEIQEVPQVELAAKLNLSYSGVKTRVQRARIMLKERMDRKYHLETDAYGNVVVCENRKQQESEGRPSL